MPLSADRLDDRIAHVPKGSRREQTHDLVERRERDGSVEPLGLLTEEPDLRTRQPRPAKNVSQLGGSKRTGTLGCGWSSDRPRGAGVRSSRSPTTRSRAAHEGRRRGQRLRRRSGPRGLLRSGPSCAQGPSRSGRRVPGGRLGRPGSRPTRSTGHAGTSPRNCASLLSMRLGWSTSTHRRDEGKIHPVRPGVQSGSEVDDVSIPEEIAERRNASIRTVRMATTQAPSGRLLAIRSPRSPANRAASGSWNNASGRLDSISRQPAVSKADSVT